MRERSSGSPLDPGGLCAVQVAAVSGRGGIETAVRCYAAMFDRVGAPSLCLYRGPARAELAAAGLTLIDLPERLMGVLRGFPGLGASVRRKILDKAGGRRIVFIVHSDRALPALRRLFPRATFVAPCHSDKTAGKADADLVITLNADQHERVSRALRGARCRVSQLGNPFERPDAPAPSGGAPRLIYSARFIETKDPLATIRAHAALTTAPELVMIGDGPLMAGARAAADPSVRFLGWRADPWSEVTRSDILVSTSRWEGLPYLLLEALGRGVPVVASDIAGHRAALGDGRYGALYPLGDHQALVAALERALSRPGEFAAMAQAGRESVAARFGASAFWGRLARELAAVAEPG